MSSCRARVATPPWVDERVTLHPWNILYTTCKGDESLPPRNVLLITEELVRRMCVADEMFVAERTRGVCQGVVVSSSSSFSSSPSCSFFNSTFLFLMFWFYYWYFLFVSIFLYIIGFSLFVCSFFVLFFYFVRQPLRLMALLLFN